MELLKKNYLDTTSSLTVPASTSTANFLFDPDLRFQWVTDSFNNDLTTASVTIRFTETLAVSRIGVMGHNLKGYSAYYNGSTANTFALTSTSDTTTVDYSTNSETSQYFAFTSVNATSVTFDFKTTQSANQEKAIGYIYVGTEHLVFERIASAKGYSPKVDAKQVVHTLSDGGTRIQFIDNKRAFSIKYSYISSTFKNNLKTVYDIRDEMVFVPFGTTTAWDELLVPVVWEGDFDFFKHSDNAVDAGFEGIIRLKETSVS